MPRTSVTGVDIDPLLKSLRLELKLPADFQPDVLAAADGAAQRPLDRTARFDATRMALVTLDPPGSKDLDQAFLLERSDTGYRLNYAIADVAAFVDAGGDVDREAHVRGETLYLPNDRIPLHPPALSE